MDRQTYGYQTLTGRGKKLIAEQTDKKQSDQNRQIDRLTEKQTEKQTDA